MSFLSLRRTALAIGCLGALCSAAPVAAQSDLASASRYGGKLLLTGGVTQVEGTGGGGLTPWALIGGYGTRDQIGANAYYTRVGLDDYTLDSYGALVGLYDRVEFSVARQRFDTENVGAALGLGRGFTFTRSCRWAPSTSATTSRTCWPSSARSGAMTSISTWPPPSSISTAACW